MEILELIGVPYFKKGKGIHIKKKNRGKFTEYCGGKVTQECINRAKKSGNPTLKKRAVFAENARAWKHQKGGYIDNGASILGGKYGHIQNAKTAYKLGMRDQDAVLSMAPTELTGMIKGTIKSSADKNSETMNYRYKRNLSNGQTVTNAGGINSDGSQYETYGFTLPNGDSAEFDLINQTYRYNRALPDLGKLLFNKKLSK